MFTYEINEPVVFIHNGEIESGVVLGRKMVDAPNWTNPPSLQASDYNHFNYVGCRLGRSEEIYEIAFDNPNSGFTGLTLRVDQLYLSVECLLDELKHKFFFEKD